MLEEYVFGEFTGEDESKCILCCHQDEWVNLEYDDLPDVQGFNTNQEFEKDLIHIGTLVEVKEFFEGYALDISSSDWEDYTNTVKESLYMLDETPSKNPPNTPTERETQKKVQKVANDEKDPLESLKNEYKARKEIGLDSAPSRVKESCKKSGFTLLRRYIPINQDQAIVSLWIEKNGIIYECNSANFCVNILDKKRLNYTPRLVIADNSPKISDETVDAIYEKEEIEHENRSKSAKERIQRQREQKTPSKTHQEVPPVRETVSECVNLPDDVVTPTQTPKNECLCGSIVERLFLQESDEFRKQFYKENLK